MAKNRNTFEKRQKELKRMQKAQDKRERRFARESSSVEPQSRDESLPTPEVDVKSTTFFPNNFTVQPDWVYQVNRIILYVSKEINPTY